MTKATDIAHLLEYFNNDINFFISKVDLNIAKYLNCLSATEVKEIYRLTLNTPNTLNPNTLNPNTINPNTLNPNTPNTPNLNTPNTLVPSAPPFQTTAQTTTTIQPYLPFDSKRPTENINERISKMIKERKINRRQQNLMILGQLYKDDVINNIKIIKPLSLRDDTLIYIGKQGNKKVIVKIQPRNKKEYNFRLPNYSYQLATEANFFNSIKKYNLTTIPTFYFYGNVAPLDPTIDIERYMLVMELLGSNLTILKNKPVATIVNGVLLALKTIQSLHSCGITSTPKESFIHKDVKHENFVFTDDTMTTVKVIDFGLAESLYDRNNKRKIAKEYYTKPGDGTPLYMSTMQHKISIHDYMDDFQAFAWMLLDLLGDQPIATGMPWYNATTNEQRLAMKLEFIAKCKNSKYAKTLANGTLTPYNIAVIGELATYTINRTQYSTDLKNDDNIYYTEYNEQYYKDIETIIKKLI